MGSPTPNPGAPPAQPAAPGQPGGQPTPPGAPVPPPNEWKLRPNVYPPAPSLRSGHSHLRYGVMLGLGLLIGMIVFVGIVLESCRRSMGNGSCPHIYSFNGTEHVLDADPVSGAFLAAAERDDVVRLEQLRLVDGRYRLQVRNDLPERDYVDELSLLLVDHLQGEEVLPTQEGEVHRILASTPPLWAKDSHQHEDR